MGSLQRKEGFLSIDNRCSGGSLLEAATLTCVHCQRTWLKNPQRVRPRNYCAKCDAYICDNPGCNSECRPFWKSLDEELTRIINSEANHG